VIISAYITNSLINLDLTFLPIISAHQLRLSAVANKLDGLSPLWHFSLASYLKLLLQKPPSKQRNSFLFSTFELKQTRRKLLFLI